MFSETHAARTLSWLFFCCTLSTIVPAPDRRAEKMIARSQKVAREGLDVVVGQRLFPWDCYQPVCRSLLFREHNGVSAEHVAACHGMAFELLADNFEALVHFDEQSAESGSHGVLFFSNSLLQCLVRTLAQTSSSSRPAVQACRVACKICDSNCAKLKTNLMLTLHDSLPDVQVREGDVVCYSVIVSQSRIRCN